MTLDEGIRYFEEQVEYYKDQERGLDNLPGIYYDPKDHEKYKRKIENNEQFVKWLKELKNYKQLDKSINFPTMDDVKDILKTRSNKDELAKELHKELNSITFPIKNNAQVTDDMITIVNVLHWLIEELVHENKTHED